jgi:hypothetical protein
MFFRTSFIIFMYSLQSDFIFSYEMCHVLLTTTVCWMGVCVHVLWSLTALTQENYHKDNLLHNDSTVLRIEGVGIPYDNLHL